MSSVDLTKVCDVSALDDNPIRCVSLSDRNVLVARTSEGIFVTDEMCTHEDARLCDGHLNGTLIKCPLHGSRFDLKTGRVLDDPADVDLVTYPVTVLDQIIYIKLEQPK